MTKLQKRNTSYACRELVDYLRSHLDTFKDTDAVIENLAESGDTSLEIYLENIREAFKSEPDRVWTGSPEHSIGDIVEVFGWYGEQKWEKVMLTTRLNSGEWEVKRIRKS
jgi:hypothetical protein